MYKCLLVALLFVGCSKYPDTLDPVACKCKLLSISSNTEGDYKVEYRYDEKNRFSQRIVTYNSSDHPDLRVYYDKLGRVSEYLGNGNRDILDAMFDQWHFLYYDNKNRVVTDTVYYGGVTGPDGPANVPDIFEYTIRVFTFEYDSQNRIIKISGSPYGTVQTFAYDTAGNLILNTWWGAPVVYDDKVNWNRTDPFLQFVHRDYSKNNRVGAGSYNKYGLPLAYTYIDGTINYIEPYGIYPAIFTYKCKS
jgi:YD repeat-containing protein